MSLTAADVAQIMQLLENSNFQELSLELNGLKLHLRRDGLTEVGTTHQPMSAEAVGANDTGKSAAPNTALHEVTAPLLGTFYRAPKPGAPPFVELGAAVEPDTVIGIIEVMKLMNSVRAGVRGTVMEIVGGDGALVEFGETLLRVAKSG